MGVDTQDQEALVTELRAKIVELEQTVKKQDEEISELKMLSIVDKELLEVQKETEKELKDQLDQEAITISQLEYQLEEKDKMTDKLEFALIKFREKIDELNDQIKHQQEELNGQMSAEQMISELTSKNLDLEEQMKLYETTIAELEEMHQLNEAIIEAKEETERELRQQIDDDMIEFSTLKRQLVDMEDRVVDFERLIIKFRQKTAELNEEVQNQKDELATMRAREEEKAKNAGAEISLLTNANRTFYEVVEAEQRSIELESAKQHISYLRGFLPDNFTKPGGDNDCLLLCVLFPRMSTKALSLARLLQQKYPQAPGGLRREHVTLSHRGEQWSHVRRFGYQLQLLHSNLQKITSVLKHCSADRLSRLAKETPPGLDIACQEKYVDQYFDLLRQNRFDENTSIDLLERVVQYFQRLYSAHLSTEQHNVREDLRNTLVQIKEGLGWVQFNGQRLRHFLIGAQQNSADSATSSSELTASLHSSLMAKSMTGSQMSTASGGGTTEADFLAFVDRLSTLLTECEGLVIRALNRIPLENNLILTSELSDRLLTAISALEKCGRTVHECCAMAVSQLSAVDQEGLPAQQLLEFLRGEVEKFAGRVDSQKGVNAHFFEERGLELVKSVLDELSIALENSSMEITPSRESQKGATTSGFPPLLDRAHSRKNDAVEAEGLRWQITKKDEEMLKLQRTLRARESDIGTMKLRLEMAEKQLTEVAGGSNAELQRLQQRYSELEEEMNKQKIDSERALLEEQSKTRGFSKKAFIANIQQQQATAALASPSASTPIDGSIFSSSGHGTLTAVANEGGTTSGEQMASLCERELHSTKDELRQAKNKIRVLESQHLPDLAGMLCSRCTEREKAEETELAEMLAESEELVKVAHRYQLRPVDFREYDKYRKTVESINFRADSLRIRFERFWRKYHPCEAIPELRTPKIKALS